MTKLGCCIILSCITLAFGRSQTPTDICRDTTHQTCNGFSQCCASTCGGAHTASCSEAHGRISQADCRCTGRSGSTGGSTSGGSLINADHSNVCRLAAGSSCASFRGCCNNKCSPADPARLTCTQTGNTLSNTHCECFDTVGGHSTSSGHGHSMTDHRHTTPHTTLVEVGDQQDYSHTCARNNRDCQAFRTCCTNRCSGQSMETQCQESFGSLRNTVCKCTRRH